MVLAAERNLMKKCKSGRIIEKNRKGKIIYVLRLNLVEDDFKKGKKYTTKDIHTDLSVGKRNYQKAAVLLEEAMDSYKDESNELYFHNYCSVWLEDKKPTLELTTYEGYQYKLKILISYFSQQPVLLSELTEKDIKDFYNFLLTAEHGTGKRRKVGYSSRTIKDIAFLLKSVLNEATTLKYISANPAAEISIPCKVEDKHNGNSNKAYIDTDEVATFFEAIKGHRLELPFILGLYFGLRREEILGLKWAAIHKDGRLYIEHTVARVKTTIRKNRVKTDASYRSYPLSDFLLVKLKERQKEQQRNKLLFGDNYISSDYIFTWEDGHLYTPDYFSKSFKKVVRRNPNLDDSLTLHSLRASCVSILIHNGMDIKDIQEWVGHKDIQTTLNLYARTNEKRKTKVDKKMSEIVFKDA